MQLGVRASSIGLGLALGALAAGGISYAVTAPSGTVINACQSKSTGALRILNSGACKATETTISWNPQGPQGESGVQGPQGVMRAQGDRGPATYANSVEGIAKALSVPSQRLWSGKRVIVQGPVHLALQDIQVAGLSAGLTTLTGSQGFVTVTLTPGSDSNCASSQPTQTVKAASGSALVDSGQFDTDVCVNFTASALEPGGADYNTYVYAHHYSWAEGSAQLITLSPAELAKASQ